MRCDLGRGPATASRMITSTNFGRPRHLMAVKERRGSLALRPSSGETEFGTIFHPMRDGEQPRNLMLAEEAEHPDRLVSPRTRPRLPRRHQGRATSNSPRICPQSPVNPPALPSRASSEQSNAVRCSGESTMKSRDTRHQPWCGRTSVCCWSAACPASPSAVWPCPAAAVAKLPAMYWPSRAMLEL
jgi:hypothetical protein